MKHPSGLPSDEAARRLKAEGPNQLERKEGPSRWAILLAQFKSPVTWLLLGACVISAALREMADAIAIGTIVVLNALVGFFQEYRAERSMLALRSMTAPRARVWRDGAPHVVPASEVVRGDVLLLEAGDVVAADAQLFRANRLQVNEAALTGESEAAQKSTPTVESTAPLAERSDTVFMGTSIINGTGSAEVSATAMKTELGKVAHLLSTAEGGTTPMQKRLEHVSRTLIIACLGVVIVVAGVGLIRGLGAFAVFLSAVSLAIAAVPEGLPAVVTIALAFGVRRMAARHVLVRHLPAVETLGCATVICTDKTGTLTTGVMTVRDVWGPDEQALLEAGAACCDATLAADAQSGLGDSTEVAILMAAAARGIDRKKIELERPRTSVNPFDAERKRMSILRSDGVLYVKGAGESLFALCTSGTEGAAEANTQLAKKGLRVLAVATGASAEERGLHLLGLVGIADPPRKEAIAAIAAAHEAGIKTVMITGDNQMTADVIAAELGLVPAGVSTKGIVHARATPEDKLNIVRSLKEQGEIVAMTGDGVNDAPALREAHIGICMGQTGTEVTREASDMVLSDDNFASIVAAIREGRGIFDNIRKALVYLLAGNAGELTLMLVASIAGLPAPLLPLQLLWINLVTDGMPALALVMDPTSPDVMTQPPRRASEPILGRQEWTTIAVTGAIQMAVTLGVYIWALNNRNLIEARTLAFSTIVLTELFRSFASRSVTRVFWQVGAFSNLTLLGVVFVSALLQVALHVIPFTATLFQISTPSLPDAALCVALALVPVTVIELTKLLRRAVRGEPPSHGVAA